MPNRIIREGWLESGRIDSLDAPAERFFLRLCLKADDFGRFHAAPQLLKSLLFPLKEDIRNTDMSRCLAACEKAGLFHCYEVAGKRYLEINNFDQRLRAKVSKFPPWQAHDGQTSDMRRLDSEAEAEAEERRRREVEAEEKKRRKARAQSIEEVQAFCKSEGLPDSDARYFWLKCQENGWKNGGQQILDWKMTIQKWKAGGYLPSQKGGANGHGRRTEQQRDQERTGLVYTGGIKKL